MSEQLDLVPTGPNEGQWHLRTDDKNMDRCGCCGKDLEGFGYYCKDTNTCYCEHCEMTKQIKMCDLNRVAVKQKSKGGHIHNFVCIHIS